MKKILIYLLISIGLSTAAYAADPIGDEELATEIDSFIQQMSDDHGFARQELEQWFDTAKPNQTILKAIKRPAESAMPWHRYRNIFLQQERIDLGLAFWKKHAKTLGRAEATFGVPAELIVGLIGVETKYGRIKGKFDVFNALYTLGFHFPRRASFFRKELKEFLMLAREQQWPIGSILGSYAGAMGYGQFMPSSYRMYAVDFDGDGKIDLLNNPVDAIGSVANYIKVHGWKTGEETIFRAKITGDGYKNLLKRSLKPTEKIAQFIAAGVSVAEKIDPEKKAVLIELQQKDHQEYWLGLQNFYVISRYNPRTLYTMAVIQLTEQIKNQYQAESSGNKQ